MVSKAILKAGGTQLQLEIDSKKPKKVTEGSLIVTGGAHLSARSIYHACILDTSWDGGKKCEPLLRSVVWKSLDLADQVKHTSISIPAIGTGALGYPSDTTARIMYDEVKSFSAKKPKTSLSDVRIVVYDKNQGACQAFEDELMKLSSTMKTPGASVLPSTASSTSAHHRTPGGYSRLKDVTTSKTSSPTTKKSDKGRHGPKSTGSLYTNLKGDKSEMKVGTITLQVSQGDITVEKTEAIVNSSNPKLDLKSGGAVQAAILRNGGDTIAQECKQLVKFGPQQPGSAVMTNAGNLNCKHIIHVILIQSTDRSNLETAISNLLKYAEKKQIKSLSIPLLGTGAMGMKAEEAADMVLGMLGIFVLKQKPKFLKLLRVIIFQSNMVAIFQNTMASFLGRSVEEPKSRAKKLLGTARSALTTIGVLTGEKKTATALGKIGEPVRNSLTLNIYAETRSNIDCAITKIKTYVDEESVVRVVEKEAVSKVMDEDLAELLTYADSLQVEIIKDTPTKIRLRGSIHDVLQVQDKLNKLLDAIDVKIRMLETQLTLAKNVNWKYEYDGKFESYDDDITGLIEMAFDKKQSSVDFEINGGGYRVDFKKMTEIDTDDSSSEVRVRRVLKEGGISLPEIWSDMADSERYKSIVLDSQSKEYIEVESYMKKYYTPKKVLQIERIQNPKLYLQYRVSRENMGAKNPTDTTNERTLFHGTSVDTVEKINGGGFNRSFAGKNATMYGKGSYFAVDATYPATRGYAAPDDKGIMRMYQAKVLTGLYCKGDPNMLVPPSKNPKDPTDYYDSVVDNVANPVMFVVFNDAMAYPEYLITFQ
ncbi:protein mono-ADP-ribosyltransferase PARP14-like isoform X2 [Glandiceps talaboti]